MSRLLYVFAALVFIAAIIPATTATEYTCANAYDHSYMAGSVDVWVSGVNYTSEGLSLADQTAWLSTYHSVGPQSGGRNVHQGFQNTTDGVDTSGTLYDGVGDGALWTYNPGGLAQNYTVTNAATQYSIIHIGGNNNRFYVYKCYDVGGTNPYLLDADFTANPIHTSGPVEIEFTDNTTGGTETSWNWSITPATGWFVAGGSMTTEDLSVYFSENGNYTVSHGVAGPYNSDIETKSDYIWIYNSTDLATTGFYTQDLWNGADIINSVIGIQDIENGSWTNTTTTDGFAFITTLNGHHLNAYATAYGYEDADLLNQPAWNSYAYAISMVPKGFTNVTPGNITLYVTVLDSAYRTGIKNAMVDIAIGGDTVLYGTTNAAGGVSFVVPNNTDVRITANAAGYGDASYFENTGTGSGGSAIKQVEITLTRNVVTTTPTITPTGTGGGTVAPTEDPYPCDADHPANCKRKQTDMANTLIEYGPQLLLFFIVLTFIGGVKLIGK